MKCNIIIHSLCISLLLLLFSINSYALTFYINTFEDYKNEIEDKLKMGIILKRQWCERPHTYMGKDMFHLNKIDERAIDVVVSYFLRNYEKWMKDAPRPDLFCDKSIYEIEKYCKNNNIKTENKFLGIF